ncbi:class I SAM-dependent methyltransferase [Halobiforma nitratireducens]|uniref:Type 11 methyltransferase n=1 Tax=Halobiforma nitratireducens JCM 10879 TaxID=1227454 RepID=M0LT39_9EURY|nr:class I SAM-dependent methyltransferase [Halobiforma nitratireducens]EMA36328.1 type 11 methyltransferase [Halobiforma nitratireducens JCM 10879]
MATIAPFETLTEEYDEWFDDNEGAYHAELTALERALPDREVDTGPDGDTHTIEGKSEDENEGSDTAWSDNHTLEIGVGTGRFAGPLAVPLGIDPAATPLETARDRGVGPVRGVAESLPIADDAADCVLVVTVLSFVDDLEATLAEAHRVLADDGTLVAAVLDRSSPVGQVYQEHKDESPFYADAEFLTAREACDALEDAGFEIEQRLQTIFDEPAAIPADDEPTVRDGHGDGLFAVVRATPGEG